MYVLWQGSKQGSWRRPIQRKGSLMEIILGIIIVVMAIGAAAGGFTNEPKL